MPDDYPTLIDGSQWAWVYAECNVEICAGKDCEGKDNIGQYVSYNTDAVEWGGAFWLWCAEDEDGVGQHLCHECFGHAVHGLLASRQGEHDDA